MEILNKPVAVNNYSVVPWTEDTTEAELARQEIISMLSPAIQKATNNVIFYFPKGPQPATGQ